MSQKFMSQHSDLVSTPRLPRVNGRHLRIIGALLIVILIALAAVNARPAANETAVTVPATNVTFSNALEMQYARPYITGTGSGTVADASYSDALALQYARPYLTDVGALTAVNASYSDALALQYAQPWLNQIEETAGNGNEMSPLERQYAQPWIAQ